MKKTEIIIADAALLVSMPDGVITKYEGGYFRQKGKSIEIIAKDGNLKETFLLNDVSIWATE